MANEIALRAFLRVENGASRFQLDPGTLVADQSSIGGPSPGMIVVGTTVEQVDMSELSAPGWCIMQNLDSTNYVEWGFSSGVLGGRILPSAFVGPIYFTDSAELWMKADSGNCKVMIAAIER